MVLAQHFCRGYSGTTTLVLTPAVDWLDGSVGSGGLLLVVSYLLQFRFQFYGWEMGGKVS